MIELLATFEPTTDNKYLISVVEITDMMLYRENYKQNAKYVFDGERYKVWAVFNMSSLMSREDTLRAVSNYIKANLRGNKK